MSKLGLIAGNGRFPFLVLDAARRAGHDVTVIALREETFPDLAAAAARAPAAPVHWISLGQLGRCISLLKDAGVDMTTSEPLDLTITTMTRVMDEMERLLSVKKDLR